MSAGRNRGGFTIVEMLLVTAIIGILSALGIPRVQEVAERARVARAITQIKAIEAEISALDSLPASLADVGRDHELDPWGRPFVYLRLQMPVVGRGAPGRGGAGSAPDIGSARKDKFLVPLNSDYDLYSVGRDGASVAPLAAPSSRDDVLRANNGSFVGLAVRY